MIEEDNMRLVAQSWQQGLNILNELVLHAALAQRLSSAFFWQAAFS